MNAVIRFDLLVCLGIFSLQLRFKDELSLLCEGLPTFRRFEGHKGMRAFIQNQVQQCLLDEVPKFTSRVKKPDDVSEPDPFHDLHGAYLRA
jgi:hypothetical protein